MHFMMSVSKTSNRRPASGSWNFPSWLVVKFPEMFIGKEGSPTGREVTRKSRRL